MSGISSTLRKTSPSTIVNHGSRSLDFLNNAIKNSTVTNTLPVHNFKIDELPVDSPSSYIESSKVSVHPFLIPSTRDRFLASFKVHGHGYGDVNKIDVTGGEKNFAVKRNITFSSTTSTNDRIQWFEENFLTEELSTHQDLTRFEISQGKYDLTSLNELPDLNESLEFVLRNPEIDHQSKLDYLVFKVETEPKQCIDSIMEVLQDNEVDSAVTFVKVVNHLITAHAGNFVQLKSYSSEIIKFYQYLNELNPEKLSSDLDVNYSLLSFFVHAGYYEQASILLQNLFIEQGLTVNDSLFTKFIVSSFMNSTKRDQAEKLQQLYPFRSAIITAFSPRIFKTLLSASETFSEVNTLIQIAHHKSLNVTELFQNNEELIVNKLSSLVKPKTNVSQVISTLTQLQPDFTKLSQQTIRKLLITTLKAHGSYIYSIRLVNLLKEVDDALVEQVYKIDAGRKIWKEVGNPGYDQVGRDGFYQVLNEKKK